MPALGSPIVRQLRRMARSLPGPLGDTLIDSIEVIGAYEAERVDRMITRCGSRRAAGHWSQQGPSPRPRSGSREYPGPPRRGRTRRSSSSVPASLASRCVYRLHRHGIAATLYEAQERIGGRCFSLRGFFDAGQTAEHGGQYIDSRHHHIRSLAKEPRIPLVDRVEQSFPCRQFGSDLARRGGARHGGGIGRFRSLYPPVAGRLPARRSVPLQPGQARGVRVRSDDDDRVVRGEPAWRSGFPARSGTRRVHAELLRPRARRHVCDQPVRGVRDSLPGRGQHSGSPEATT